MLTGRHKSSGLFEAKRAARKTEMKVTEKLHQQWPAKFARLRLGSISNRNGNLKLIQIISTSNY